ncbi:hypothetical protein [Nocardioides sp. YIM 152315]|uniref:hypothetical protein n=1 Tax=Nocardioides sp. YIM 152315 TaxID=3031760 RepID=UPI0023DA3C32|nr:hypothetical protein [Nocardioides sp. YIM 152315]MDF1606450.1 hypothetical protein [Nocardioides sp. YIM 152315]
MKVVGAALLLVLLCTGPVPVATTATAAVGPAHREDCSHGDGTFKVLSKRTAPHQPSGSFGVYAWIQSRAKGWRTHVRGEICFFDKRGRVLETERSYADALAVAPRGKTSFYISEDAPARWHHFTIRFQSRKTALRTVRHHVDVATHDVRIDELTGLQVPVTVTNRNPFTIDHVRVFVTLFDRRERIVSTNLMTYDYTDPDRLPAGASGEFVARSFHSHRGMERAVVQVEAFR